MSQPEESHLQISKQGEMEQPSTANQNQIFKLTLAQKAKAAFDAAEEEERKMAEQEEPDDVSDI